MFDAAGRTVHPAQAFANGVLMAPDGRPVRAVSFYAAPPADGRPLKAISYSLTDGLPVIAVSEYPNGVLMTADGRPVTAVASTTGPELLQSYDFSAATGWTMTGAGTIAGGTLNLGAAQFSEATQFSAGGGVAVAAGDQFVLVVIVTTLGDAGPVIRVGDNGVLNSILVAQPLIVGTNTFTFTSAAAHPSLAVDVFNNLAGTVGPVIDSISLKRQF